MIKILIVEDEVLVAESLKMDLQDVGLDVCGWASEANEALSMIESQNPDLILMDIYISSEIDGIDVAKRALKMNSDVKIIFVTGYNRTSFIDKLVDVKYEGILEKPVRAYDIIDVINEIAVN